MELKRILTKLNDAFYKDILSEEDLSIRTKLKSGLNRVKIGLKIGPVVWEDLLCGYSGIKRAGKSDGVLRKFIIRLISAYDNKR